MIEITKITGVMDNIAGLSAVVFDLDDTLYGEKEYVRSGYRAVAKILPQVADAEGKLWSAFENGKPAIDTMLAEEGIFSNELKEECLSVYRYHAPEIHLYDGVVEMLLELRRRGIKTGIITDGRPEGQRAKIAALGLADMVDKIIITDELGGVEYRKPCEKAFCLMWEALEGMEYRESCGENFHRIRTELGNPSMVGETHSTGLAYHEMCYVGDNIQKDFIAPEKLGMRAIWYRNPDGIYK